MAAAEEKEEEEEEEEDEEGQWKECPSIAVPLPPPSTTIVVPIAVGSAEIDHVDDRRAWTARSAPAAGSQRGLSAPTTVLLVLCLSAPGEGSAVVLLLLLLVVVVVDAGPRPFLAREGRGR